MTLVASLLVAALAAPAAAPAVAGATCQRRYHEPATFLANPDESVLIAAVIGWCRRHQTRLLWDERYAQAARLWSEQLAAAGGLPERALPAERLRFELQRRGVSDAQVVPFSLEGPGGRVPPELLDYLDEHAGGGRFSHFAVGVGRLPGQQRMVTTLLLGRRQAVIEPLPACPPPGEQLELELRLLRGFSHPTWLVTTPAGRVVRDLFTQQQGRYRARVPLDRGPGTYQLEVLVQGNAGPEVAALMPLYVGVAPPRAPLVKLRPAPRRYQNPQEAEAALLALVNQEREHFDLPPLVPDAALAKVARGHALEVLAGRQASHRSRSGSLPDRLRAAGLSFVRALENIAMAGSPEAAHQKLMDSPGHRLNILDPGVTHLGVGVALERSAGGDAFAVCQVFAERAPAAGQQRLARRILELVNARRRQRGRFNLGWDEQLARAAQLTARRLAGLGEEADAAAQSQALVAELEQGDENLRAVTARILLTADPRRVARAPEALDEDINRLGVGLVPAGAREPVQYWIVAVFAGR